MWLKFEYGSAGKKWKGRWDYKPGRTPEELEDERRRETLAMSYTERYIVMMRLMRLQKMLSTAKIPKPANKELWIFMMMSSLVSGEHLAVISKEAAHRPKISLMS